MNSDEHCGTITHEFPVWRERADFILVARLLDSDVPAGWRWEQLWARRITDERFEICCVPFVMYGLALGDVVTIRPLEERTHVVDEVVARSGHTTYRLWFPWPDDWSSIIDRLRSMGCIVEARWEKSSLIGIDAPDEVVRAELEQYLDRLEKTMVDVSWESGM